MALSPSPGLRVHPLGGHPRARAMHLFLRFQFVSISSNAYHVRASHNVVVSCSRFPPAVGEGLDLVLGHTAPTHVAFLYACTQRLRISSGGARRQGAPPAPARLPSLIWKGRLLRSLSTIFFFRPCAVTKKDSYLAVLLLHLPHNNRVRMASRRHVLSLSCAGSGRARFAGPSLSPLIHMVNASITAYSNPPWSSPLARASSGRVPSPNAAPRRRCERISHGVERVGRLAEEEKELAEAVVLLVASIGRRTSVPSTPNCPCTARGGVYRHSATAKRLERMWSLSGGRPRSRSCRWCRRVVEACGLTLRRFLAGGLVPCRRFGPAVWCTPVRREHRAITPAGR